MSEEEKTLSPPRMLPEDIKEWVENTIPRFAVLAGIDYRIHYTSQLAAVMMRLNYIPKRELLAGHERMNPDEWQEPGIPAYLPMIQKHISRELLNDLEATLDLAEVDCKVEALTMHDSDGRLVEGTVYVGDGGQMSYIDKEEEKPDLSKDRGTGWGSW